MPAPFLGSPPQLACGCSGVARLPWAAGKISENALMGRGLPGGGEFPEAGCGCSPVGVPAKQPEDARGRPRKVEAETDFSSVASGCCPLSNAPALQNGAPFDPEPLPCCSEPFARALWANWLRREVLWGCREVGDSCLGRTSAELSAAENKGVLEPRRHRTAGRMPFSPNALRNSFF